MRSVRAGLVTSWIACLVVANAGAEQPTVPSVGSSPAVAAPATPPAPPPEGFSWQPSLFWKSGAHRVDLGVAVRVREEAWDAFSTDTDWYTATRTRLRAQYGWAEKILVGAELQDVRLHGLDTDSTGAALLYRNSSGRDSNTHGTALRAAWLEVRPVKTLAIRFGRQDVKLGNEVLYPEPNWRYLKAARISERLVGTVGWSHAERANDGLTVSWDLGDYQAYGFMTRPTTGVFDVDSAYHRQHEISVSGLAGTAKRGVWLPDTELGAFGLVYRDDRNAREGGLAEPVSVYTLGFQSLGIYPCGPGQIDFLTWFAGQAGRYNGTDHLAGAAIVEGGYQLPTLWSAPWLRLGVNLATGDGNDTDDVHHTFFNMLPTNHLYYGFADQLAFENLMDSFVQLRLSPHEKLQLNLFVHRFRLMNDGDRRYGGTGAFDKRVFGFPSQPSRGYNTIGTEYDFVATIPIHRTLTLEGGYSLLDGAKQLRRDVQFGYMSLEFKY